MKPQYEIQTGYRIGGKTWISRAWNAGELTRDDIHDAIAGYVSEETEEEIHDEQADNCEIAEALQDLYDNWTDDTDDEDQFGRVYRAHKALDDYCRRLLQGEYDW